ncbi:MAG: DUF2782 domain-containing protein [Gammaproteobacteria bacterium]|nr:MAG: DUF2782 domain-containing protein [Gammaproteobacteria bacterium]
MRFTMLLLSLVITPAVLAAEAEIAPAPEPPEIPEQVQSGETLEPDITIIQKKEEVVEEYRVNGRLYQVKITPARGLPYYLIDTDGDGELETRANDITKSQVPQWVLFSWD